MPDPVVLEPAHRALLAETRRATLATIAPDGRARLVPCCFALLERPDGTTLYTPIDAKPKRSAEAQQLARIRDIQRDPRVTVLVDGWDEDWSRLWWLRVDGHARVLWPDASPAEHPLAIVALRDRYPQYLDHPLEQLPVIAIAPTSIAAWHARGDPPGGISPRP